MDWLYRLIDRLQALWNMPYGIKSDADKSEQAFIGLILAVLLMLCVSIVVLAYLGARKLLRKRR